MAGERTLPGLGLTGYWNEGSDGWKAAMDTNLRLLSAMCSGAAISRTTVLPGSPTNGDIYIVRSDAGTNPNKIALRDNGAWVYLAPSEGWRLWVKDEDALAVYTGSAWAVQTRVRPISWFFTSAPTSSEVLAIYVAAEAITLADDFAGSVGTCGTNPTATFTLTVRKNGSSVGTIAISTSGVFTFTTTGGAVTLAAGDVLRIVAPSGVDGTVANVAATLRGIV